MIESINVPPSVLYHLQRCLKELHSISNRLNDVRRADDMFGGAGRYESESFDALDLERQGCIAYVEKFRTHAPAQGVNPELVLEELGGMPSFKRSERCLAYLGQHASP